jgi:O-antigen/teichoic acid export membrane protein
MTWSKIGRVISVFRDGISSTQYYAMAMQYMSMAISLFNVFLLSKLYGFESVGIFAFYLSAQQMIGFAATLGVGAYSIRVLSRTLNQRRTIMLLGYHAVVVLIIFLIAAVINEQFEIRESHEFVMLLVATWFGLIRFILEDVCAGIGWFVRSSLIAMIENCVRLYMLLILGVNNASDALYIIIISTAVAVLIIGYFVVKKFFSYNNKPGRYAYTRIYYLNSLVMFSSHFTSLLQNRLGVLTAPQFLSYTEAGIFALLLTLSEITLRIGGMIARYIYALGSQRINQNVLVGPVELVRVVTLIGVLISIVMLSIFPLLNTYIYDSTLDGYFCAFLILCSYALIFLYVNLSGNLLYGRGASGDVLLSSIYGVSISVLVIAIAWSFASLVGLCSALAAGALVSSVLNASSLRKNKVSHLGVAK